MRDREGERWLWTGESTECLCGHSFEYHDTLGQNRHYCIICANGDNYFHQFIARRQPLELVTIPPDGYLLCSKCNKSVRNNAIKIAEHEGWHREQEEWR